MYTKNISKQESFILSLHASNIFFSKLNIIQHCNLPKVWFDISFIVSF